VDLETKSQNVTDWVESVIKDKLPKDSLRNILLDGVVLCKLANALKSGCIKKFHRKPRMLMMKIENIAFFLTACKSRFNIPQSVIFAPTDIHDDSDPTSMRKVVNVLMLIKSEFELDGGGESIAEAAEKLRQAEEEREKMIAAELEAEGIAPEPKKPSTFVMPDMSATAASEPEPEHDPEPEPEPAKPAPKVEAKPEPKPEPKPVAKVEPKPEPKPAAKVEPPKPEPKSEAPKATPATAKQTAAPAAKATNGAIGNDTEWYLHGKLSDYVDVQPDVSKEILAVVHSELSVEYKTKLISSLEAQLDAFYQKLVTASVDDLRQLAHTSGLGHSVNDVPTGKPRQWYVDFIVKYGRGH